MARGWLQLRQQLEEVKRELARNGETPSSELILRLASLVDEALENDERRAVALASAFDDLDNRQLAFDNSRFFRLLRWPGRFLLDWKGRLGQLLLRSPLHPLYRRLAGPPAALAEYAAWLDRERDGTMPPDWFTERVRLFRYRPLISIILPVYCPRREWLHAALESVLAQTYPCWEICISDDGSPDAWVSDYLAARAAADPRLHFIHNDRNTGISAASNRAAERATGDYVAFLDQDDLLPPYALHYIVAALQSGTPDLVYTDEDRLDENGRRVEPVFKPAWSPDLLLSGMYMGHFLVVRRSAADQVGWLRPACDGAQDFDLALRIADHAALIRHIPRVLYHWRKHPGSTAADPVVKPYTQAAGFTAVSDAVTRRQYDAVCENGLLPNSYRVRWNTSRRPKVSLVICSRTARLLRQCVKAIAHRTAYPNFELVFVEHGVSTGVEGGIRVPYAGPFNYARMNNSGAAAATGEILVFLNDDVEPLAADWLDHLVMHAQRPEVGVAGAQLLYPSGAIQHAGLALGIMKNGVGHLCRDTFGIKYWHWLAFARNVSAVTAACLAIRKELFQQLGGFDIDFPVNYNDADLCLRARQLGYTVIYEPAALLRHYEASSRTPGVRYREQERWRERWSDWMDRGDPYYTPNLSRDREDASLSTEVAGPEDNSR